MARLNTSKKHLLAKAKALGLNVNASWSAGALASVIHGAHNRATPEGVRTFSRIVNVKDGVFTVPVWLRKYKPYVSLTISPLRGQAEGNGKAWLVIEYKDGSCNDGRNNTPQVV